MSFIYALIPLSGATAVLALGGRCVPITLICSVSFGLLCGKRMRHFALLLCTVSAGLRLLSVLSLSRGYLGDGSAIFFSLLCALLAVFSSRKSGVRFAATPVFILASILAVFTAVISSGEVQSELSESGGIEYLTAAICPLGAAVAAQSEEGVATEKRAKSLAIGVFAAVPFILLPSRFIEFALLSVPVTVITAAIEFDTAYKAFSGSRKHKIG